MGARVSVSFKRGANESVVLFSHWGGDDFAKEADNYITKLKQRERKNTGISDPLTRLEPETVMVDFIRHLTDGMGSVRSDLYLCKNREDGDNSDYGHFTISLDNSRDTNML